MQGYAVDTLDHQTFLMLPLGMPKIAVGPTACLEENPSRQSVKFGGQFVSLTAISKAGGVDRGYLSHIFAGRRNPSLQTLQNISSALGMSLQDFLDCLEEKRQPSSLAVGRNNYTTTAPNLISGN